MIQYGILCSSHWHLWLCVLVVETSSGSAARALGFEEIFRPAQQQMHSIRNEMSCIIQDERDRAIKELASRAESLPLFSRMWHNLLRWVNFYSSSTHWESLRHHIQEAVSSFSTTSATPFTQDFYLDLRRSQEGGGGERSRVSVVQLQINKIDE